MPNTIGKKYTTIKNCRISGSPNIIDVLDLGIHPLANSLTKSQEKTPIKFPLSLSFCEQSSLLQLNQTVGRQILFDHYLWVTGTSQTANDYARIFTDGLIATISPNINDLIIEIASNDGTFLKPLLSRGFNNVLGVDPAKNLAGIANTNGIPTLPEYWSSSLASQIIAKDGLAKIVFARNVIPHVSELLDVINGIEISLRDDGVGVIEFHDAGKIINELQYDSIYHEHLCYFSIKSITYLLNRYELNPFHIEKSPISGGAWVIYFSKEKRSKSSKLEQAIIKEKSNKVNFLSTWQVFAECTKIHRRETLDIINSLDRKKVVGFGSSARSQTYLNYCGIDNTQINAIIDNNPFKQGMFTPGSLIPIVDFEQGMALNPDIIIILAWNFRDEIVKACRSYGYKHDFLVPFPKRAYFFNGG